VFHVKRYNGKYRYVDIYTHYFQYNIIRKNLHNENKPYDNFKVISLNNRETHFSFQVNQSVKYLCNFYRLT
jgi:hypothetical protein